MPEIHAARLTWPTRRAFWRLAAGAALAGIRSPARAQGHETVSLMLNWSAYGEHAPFFLGRERGYFETEGITLDIQPGRGSWPAIQAVAARTVMFGYADIPTMIRIAARGAPVKAIGVALQTGPIAVLALTERRILAAADLRGRTLVMSPGDPASQLWPLWRDRAGLRDDDLRVIWRDPQARLDAVLSGQADAMLGYLTDEAVRLVQASRKPVTALRFADLGLNLVGTGIVARADLLREKTELVRRFARASSRSFEQAQASPQAAVEAMLGAGAGPGSREWLLAGLKAASALYRPPGGMGGRPLQADASTMAASFALLAGVYGLDPTAAGRAEDYYSNDFLP